jgi:hypothetical protein
MSSDWALMLCASVSASSACASETFPALFSSRLVDASALGGPAAIVAAS